MRLAILLVFVTILCGVAYYVFSHPNLEQLERLEGELAQLSAQNEALARENESLEQQIRALREDPRHVERRAREVAGLARPDELIFQFEEPDQAVAVRVRLNVAPEKIEFAGQPIELSRLADGLASLRAEMPNAVLTVTIDDEVGPIERQRIIDIVDASPMAPAKWEPSAR